MKRKEELIIFILDHDSANIIKMSLRLHVVFIEFFETSFLKLPLILMLISYFKVFLSSALVKLKSSGDT